MSLNPIDIIFGAVRGAAAEALPDVLQPAVSAAVNAAHQTSPGAPLPPAAQPQIDVDQLTARIIEQLRQDPAVNQVREAAQPVVWWQSPVQIGAIVTMFAPLLALLGWSLTPAEQAQLVQLIIGAGMALSSISGLVIFFVRLFSRAQPITARRRDIESAPAGTVNLFIAVPGLFVLLLALSGHADASALRARLHPDVVRTIVLGDSIADGVRRACSSSCSGGTRVGASPAAVLAMVRRAGPLVGRRVVLSSGTSNGPAAIGAVERQLEALRGARVTLLGVGPRFARLNPRLSALARRHGARFLPLGRTGDGVHPVSYQGLAAQAGR